MPQFEFPFERDAMQGKIPPGLSLLDTGACFRLAEIYRQFREAPPEQKEEAKRRAKMEKDKLRQEWEFECKLMEHHVRMWKETELLRAKCRKDPTPENVLALCDAIVGNKG